MQKWSRAGGDLAHVKLRYGLARAGARKPSAPNAAGTLGALCTLRLPYRKCPALGRVPTPLLYDSYEKCACLGHD